MKKAFFISVLLLTSSLGFASTWSVYEVQVKQSDAPAVAAALDKFMKSDVAKSMPGFGTTVKQEYIHARRSKLALLSALRPIPERR